MSRTNRQVSLGISAFLAPSSALRPDLWVVTPGQAELWREPQEAMLDAALGMPRDPSKGKVLLVRKIFSCLRIP